MEVVENADFTRDYLDPSKRSIGNAVQVFFRDGRQTERVAVEYPVGHRRRRVEGIPLLMEKFGDALRSRLSARQADAVLALAADPVRLDATPVPRFMDFLSSELARGVLVRAAPNRVHETNPTQRPGGHRYPLPRLRAWR